jgi:hypothetical protein
MQGEGHVPWGSCSHTRDDCVEVRHKLANAVLDACKSVPAKLEMLTLRAEIEPVSNLFVLVF